MPNTLVSNIEKFLRIFINEPIKGWNLSAALIRGTIYLVFYRIVKPNVIIRFPFFAFYRVRIIGPGSVSIDENCRVEKNVFQGLTIVSLSKRAKVIIGKDCSLGGLTIRCFNEVRIGDGALIANSLIQDVAFCETSMVRSFYDSDKITPLPISIGKNVWIGMAACILSGTVLSDDCVISVGSFSYNLKIDEYCLVAGNPATKSLRIDKILSLLK